MHPLQWIIEGNFNHYVKTRVTFTVGPGPAQARPRPGPGPGKLCPGPARSPQHYYLPARARPGPASFRPAPGPARKISLRHGPARPGPWAAGRPGPRAEARPVQDPSIQSPHCHDNVAVTITNWPLGCMRADMIRLQRMV